LLEALALRHKSFQAMPAGVQEMLSRRIVVLP
jgi:hypothetical protein